MLSSMPQLFASSLETLPTTLPSPFPRLSVSPLQIRQEDNGNTPTGTFLTMSRHTLLCMQATLLCKLVLTGKCECASTDTAGEQEVG